MKLYIAIGIILFLIVFFYYLGHVVAEVVDNRMREMILNIPTPKVIIRRKNKIKEGFANYDKAFDKPKIKNKIRDSRLKQYGKYKMDKKTFSYMKKYKKFRKGEKEKIDSLELLPSNYEELGAKYDDNNLAPSNLSRLEKKSALWDTLPHRNELSPDYQCQRLWKQCNDQPLQ